MANTIVASSVIPASTDTPLDARSRISAESEMFNIENPYVGLVVFCVDNGKFYVVKRLKAKQIGVFLVENAAVDAYEEIFSGSGSDPTSATTAVPSTITLPIPTDSDGDNLSLVLDISGDGTFVNNDDGTPANYARIAMIDHFAKMRVFRNEDWETLTENCVGVPDYGSSIEFTIDSEMFSDYVPGEKYYARYKWLDTNYTGDDWTGFSFRGDVADMRPIRLPNAEQLLVERLGEISGTLNFDYVNGDVQNFTLAGDATLDLADINNVNFGSALILNCNANGHTLTVTNGKDRSMVCSGNKVFVVVVTNFGSLQIAVTETI